MQMRKVTAVRRTDGGDLLAAPDVVACVHQYLFHMPVIRLRVFAFAAFDVGMQQKITTLPQPGPPSPRQERASIRDGVNWIAQIAVFAADPIQSWPK